MEPRHERRKLMYLQWDELFRKEKPYQIVSENIPEVQHLAKQNIRMAEGPEELITDIRGNESAFSLDENGFQIYEHNFPTIDYQKLEDVEQIYKPELERLLRRNVLGVDKVEFFNWRVSIPIHKASCRRPYILLVAT